MEIPQMVKVKMPLSRKKDGVWYGIDPLKPPFKRLKKPKTVKQGPPLRTEL